MDYYPIKAMWTLTELFSLSNKLSAGYKAGPKDKSTTQQLQLPFPQLDIPAHYLPSTSQKAMSVYNFINITQNLQKDP